MLKTYNYMIIFSLLVILLVSSTIVGFAEDYNYITVRFPSFEVENISEVFENLEKDNRLSVQGNVDSNFDTLPLFTYDGETEIRYNATVFKEGTEKSKKQALNAFINELKKSNTSNQTQQNIFNTLSEADKNVSAIMIPMVFDKTSADLHGALKIISPILPVVRVILGIGSILIIFLLMISSVIDLAYIGIPMWRESQSTDKDGGNKKPFFVSNDALSTVKETESAIDSNGQYKNAYATYFMRRATTYFILSACILYLVVGELGGLISWLLNLSSGLL